MNCTVNLVPSARLRHRARARRRNVWISLCSAGSLLLLIGWGAQQAAQAALGHLEHEVTALRQQRQDIQQQLTQTRFQCTTQLDQLHKLALAHRPQPWAHRLTDLTRAAPHGVFLTGLNVLAQDAPPVPRPKPSGKTAGPADEAPSLALPPQTEYRVGLRGYALDHESLITWINAVQNLPGWKDVELVRAALEPLGGTLSVAFEIEARTTESLEP